MSSLADRIRGIVRSDVAPGLGPASPVVEPQIPSPESRDLSALGGEWRAGTFVVERRWEPSARYGREAVGMFAESLDEASSEAVLFAGGAPARAPFVFFDLETTGLSGGAGTHAFLFGCAWFDADGAFVTRQFLLTRFADERALLARRRASWRARARSSASTASRSTHRCSRRGTCFTDWIGRRARAARRRASSCAAVLEAAEQLAATPP